MDLNSRRPPRLERSVRYSLAYLQSRAKPISPLKQSAYHSINSTQNSIQTLTAFLPPAEDFAIHAQANLTGIQTRHLPQRSVRKTFEKGRERERIKKHGLTIFPKKKKTKTNAQKVYKNNSSLNMLDMCFFACRVVLNIFRAHPLPACNRCYVHM